MSASIGESDDEPVREQQLQHANDSEKAFEQAVRAGPQVIYRALSGALRAEFVGQVVRDQQWPPGSTLQIADATIRGTLDLTDLALPALVLGHCRFDTVKLDDSRAPSIELRQRCTGQQISARRLAVSGDLRVIGVQLIRSNRNGAASPGDRERERRDEADWRALDCYRLKAGGDVELQAVTVEGRIDFSGADIRGRFTCSGSLGNPGQVALTCDGMDVRGSMYVGRRHDPLRPGTRMPGPLDITGGVRLVGAHIRGEVNFTGLGIDNTGGTALDAEHLTVGSHLYLDQGFTAFGLVKLTGVNAGRQVNCTNGRFHGNGGGCAINADGLVTDSLYLNSSVVRDEGKFIAEGCIRLVGAKVRQVLCSGAKITSSKNSPSLCADRIEAGDIYLDWVQATGVVELTGAHIRDRIVCTNGKFKRASDPGAAPNSEAAPEPKAINLDGASAARLLLDKDFKATGEVSLVGATVSAELNCTGGKFINPEGNALKADRSTCGEVYLDRGFAAKGAVSFRGATLTRVDCYSGSFHAKEVKAPPATPEAGPEVTYALNLSETTINGHVLGGNLTVAGGLSLRSAHISRDLDLTDAHLTPGKNKSRMVLNGHGLTVNGTLDWQLLERPEGKVDVSHARVGRLRDDVRSWPEPESGQQSAGDLALDGFRYGSLEDVENEKPEDDVKHKELEDAKDKKKDGESEREAVWSLEDRLKWLKSSDQFSSQPYEELARVYRETGKAHDAQEVTIEEERQRRKYGGLSRPSKAWSWFLDITVGYGYKPYKILIGFAVLEIAGLCLFSYAQRQGIMEAVALPGTAQSASADKCTTNYPCFYPAVYSAELLLPVVNLRQVQYWLPDTEKPWGIAIMIFTWSTILFGWLGVTALVGGLSRIWQRT